MHEKSAEHPEPHLLIPEDVAVKGIRAWLQFDVEDWKDLVGDNVILHRAANFLTKAWSGTNWHEKPEDTLDLVSKLPYALILRRSKESHIALSRTYRSLGGMSIRSIAIEDNLNAIFTVSTGITRLARTISRKYPDANELLEPPINELFSAAMAGEPEVKTEQKRLQLIVRRTQKAVCSLLSPEDLSEDDWLRLAARLPGWALNRLQLDPHSNNPSSLRGDDLKDWLDGKMRSEMANRRGIKPDSITANINFVEKRLRETVKDPQELLILLSEEEIE